MLPKKDCWFAADSCQEVEMVSRFVERQRKSQKKQRQAHAIHVRKRAISEARISDFPDAVYCIYEFNTRHRTPPDNTPDISPYDVFNHVDPKKYQCAMDRCERLIKSSLRYGDLALTALAYKTKEEYEQIFESFRQENPGFDKKTLSKALWYGKCVMR